jgi:putative membrane protein
VKVLRQALVPVFVAFIGVSQSDTRFWPFLLPVAVIGPVVLGAIPWLTTHYRLTDSQIQVRRGLLNMSMSTAPLDRVRSVDLEASLLHRILGLQKVEIGTGVDDDRIELDALAVADAATLRTTLLLRRRTAEVPAAADLTEQAEPAPAVEPSPELLARIDWSWLRFAPFSLARLVLLAGAVGVLSQFADDLPIWNQGTATSAWEWVRQFALVAVIAVVVVALSWALRHI